MNGQNMLAERTVLFENAMNHRHNSRVPMFSNFWTWKYLDGGYDLYQVLHDYDLLEKANREFHERYQFDCYMDIGTRNPLRVSDAFGGLMHHVDASGEALVVDDRTIMYPEEYPELRDDPQEFYWTKAFHRYVKNGLTLAEFSNGVKEFMDFGAFVARIDSIFRFEYGAFSASPPNTFIRSPFEFIFSYLRGMRESAMDIHKHQTELIETMDSMWETMCLPVLQRAMTADMTGSITSVGFAFLATSILSPSQFEKFYWRYFKQALDMAMANNKRVFVFSEEEMLRFAEFYEDIPKGVLFIHPEQDDLIAFRKRLPNITIAGGMPASLLGYGTRQECIDYAKQLIDCLGEGYVFSTDKMMSYRNDAKRENLLAVTDFVRGYSY
ncbi:MAG: hypothetical protein LBU61_00015 [Coriobacteriales bacterium]|jgi:hypothetical protein|nr:hypothetical protein [Coriobacteriales bacterium]